MKRKEILFSCTVDGSVNQCSHCGISVTVAQTLAPATSHLGIFPKESISYYRDTCPSMFIDAFIHNR